MEAVDKNQIYQTRGILTKVGRSIAVDLRDSNLPHDKSIKKVHMTVLFQRGGYMQSDIQELQLLEQQFRKSQNMNDIDNYCYVLEPWGRNSMKIIGQLQELCLYLRENFKGSQDAARIPHVAMFKSERRRK